MSAESTLAALEAAALCLTRDCPTPPDGHTHGRSRRECLRCPDCCRLGGGTGVSAEYGACVECGLTIVGGQTPPHCATCDKHHSGGHRERQRCAYCRRTVWPDQEAIGHTVASEVMFGNPAVYHVYGPGSKRKPAPNGCFSAHLESLPLPVDDGKPLLRGGLLRHGR